MDTMAELTAKVPFELDVDSSHLLTNQTEPMRKSTEFTPDKEDLPDL